MITFLIILGITAICGIIAYVVVTLILVGFATDAAIIAKSIIEKEQP